MSGRSGVASPASNGMAAISLEKFHSSSPQKSGEDKTKQKKTRDIVGWRAAVSGKNGAGDRKNGRGKGGGIEEERQPRLPMCPFLSSSRVHH